MGRGMITQTYRYGPQIQLNGRDRTCPPPEFYRRGLRSRMAGDTAALKDRGQKNLPYSTSLGRKLNSTAVLVIE